MKKLILTAACIALLSACAPETTRVQTDINPTSKISLNVQRITLVDRSSTQPSNSPYNTSHFQPTIADAIRQWAGDHLQATGSTGEAVIIIKDASLTSQAIPYPYDFFTRQQASKYTGHADVDVEIKGTTDHYALTSAEATRYQTLPEHPTDLEMQNAYTVVLNGLMRDLGQNLDSGLRDHMQPYMGSPRR